MQRRRFRKLVHIAPISLYYRHFPREKDVKRAALWIVAHRLWIERFTAAVPSTCVRGR